MNEPVTERPIINIEGDLVALGPLREENIPLYVRWMNDYDTSSRLLTPPRPYTAEQEAAWVQQASNAENPTFTIFERATWQAIGNCGIHAIDWVNRTTSVGIMIGEPSARGKGFGTEAIRLLLDHAFTVLNLHSVMLTVYGYNLPAQRTYAKVGFREIGRRREARWHNGRFWDEIYMDILASEFESPVLRKMLAPKSADPSVK